MNTLRDAAQQALEALESLQGGCTDSGDGTVEAITVWCPEVIDALRAALAGAEGGGNLPPPLQAEPVPEPVAWAMVYADGSGFVMDGEAPTVDFVPRPTGPDTNWIPLYAAPPQREPLTHDQVWNDDTIMGCNATAGMPMSRLMEIVRAIERAHGIAPASAPKEQA